MFTDGRSKKVIFIAHCILNQNAISDGTAVYPGSVKKLVEWLINKNFGIVQIPCPELLCLGLDRGNSDGCNYPVLEENTRIRCLMEEKASSEKIKHIVNEVVFQISEYKKNDFEVIAIVGMNRSPSCGVDTTSKNNKEVAGKGVFIQELEKILKGKGLEIRIVGIKADESYEDLVKNIDVFSGY